MVDKKGIARKAGDDVLLKYEYMVGEAIMRIASQSLYWKTELFSDVEGAYEKLLSACWTVERIENTLYVFEKTLRELFGNSGILKDTKYTGMTCIARLDRDLLVKLSFTDPGTACNFTAISASIINRTEGLVDKQLFRFSDMVPARTGQTTFGRDYPYIWICDGKEQWCGNPLTATEKKLVRNAILDYVEMYMDIESHPAVLDGFINQTRKLWQEQGFFEARHCLPDRSPGYDYENQVVVVSPTFFSQKYRKPEYQLMLAEDGFGCSPTASGRKVYGKILQDGEKIVLNRQDIIGVIRQECMPDWAKQRLEELTAPKQEQTMDTQSM